jgi:dTDP-4-dehydrorhamnose reductase
MQILITGAAGFLGWNLTLHCAAGGHTVHAAWHRAPCAELTNARWLHLPLETPAAAMQRLPGHLDLIVHCAAIASVAACETDPALAVAINVAATRELARYAAHRHIPIAHISTDLVFDGTRGAYTEGDPVSPASRYAESKARGEEEVRAAGGTHYILRTALMYGTHRGAPGSFLGWMLDAMARGDAVALYENQFRTPLHAPDVAAVIDALLAADAPSGIYHVAGPERWSRVGIGEVAAEVFELPKNAIIPTVLQRPRVAGSFDDTTLVTEKVRRATGVTFTPLRDGLRSVRESLGRQT